MVGDLLTVAHGNGAILLKVATVSTGAIATVTVVKPSVKQATATTADVAGLTIYPSVGISATITTTVNAGSGGLLIITGFSITSSVVTFNVVNALTGGGGQTVIVGGFTGANSYLNGSYTTSTATASTVTAAITAPNVPQTTVYGTMTVQATYLTGGLPVSYQFVDQLGLPRPIGGIGPLANPNWLNLQSKSGSVFTYSTNIIQTNITPLVRIFTSGAEVSNAASIVADSIGFLAEFSFGAF